MIAPIVALALLAFALSTSLTFFARRLGVRMLLHDSGGVAGQRKLRRAVPNIGGVAIYWSITLIVLGGLAAVWFAPVIFERVFPAAAEHLPGLRSQTPMALGLLGAMLVLHVLGLVDDRRPMPPAPKFLLMFAVAAGFVLAFDTRLLTMLDPVVGGAWASFALTVLWLVAVTNAMNFMDNMDGLSAGVGAVAASLFLVAALLAGQWFVAAMLSLLVGALVGFLVFNFPRPGGATIFMGDGGSLVLGFLLAFLTVRTTYVEAPAAPLAGAPAAGLSAVFMPLCVLAVPLYDMASVILIRLAQGKSPFVGDRQHFSHRLLAAGLTVPRVLAVICGCTAITGIGGVMLSRASTLQAALIALQVCLVLAVIALYEHGKGWPAPVAPREDRP